MFCDNEDPWGMEIDSFKDVAGEFVLLSTKETAAFLEYPDSEVKPFKIVKDGDVRTVVEGIYGFGKSFAQVKYYVPMQGKAAVFQKNSAVKNDETVFVVVNDGTYSGDYDNGTFNQVILRTTGYSAHLIPKYLDNQISGDEADERRLIMPSDRYMKHINMGVREFSFEFYGDKDIGLADYNAAVFNERPFALYFFPSGKGEKCSNFIELDNKAITMSAYKKAYDDNGFIVRLYNSSDKQEKAKINITPINLGKEIVFGKFEIKTFRINVESGEFAETDIMER